jgi:ADP-ribosylglycohydrolase
MGKSKNTAIKPTTARDALLGLCVGDALGVPVEFCDRAELARTPVTGMRGDGTHHMPAGTWSDDSSLTFCTADSLAENGAFDADDVMRRFARWLKEGAYTPQGVMFDVGCTTERAIARYLAGIPAVQCGGREEHDNGNGALMRILPTVVWLLKQNGNPFSNKEIFRFAEACGNEPLHADEGLYILRDCVSMTHAHPRNFLACVIYAEAVRNLLRFRSASDAVRMAVLAVCRLRFDSAVDEQKPRFSRLIDLYNRYDCKDPGAVATPFPSYAADIAIKTFAALPESEIKSGGYVVHTLEAALFCLLNTNSYAECVLKAVNLGDDADTTAAVAGGLAGLLYGWESIPKAWLDALVRRDWILSLCDRFQSALEREA